MRIGDTEINISDSTVTIEGESASGIRQSGRALRAEISLRDDAILEVGYTTWVNGERDVRVFSRLSGPEMYDRLVKGVRMGVLSKSPGLLMAELRILSFHKDKQPTMIKAQESDFNTILGEQVRNTLSNFNISAFGTRAELIGDTSNRKGLLAATFGEENSSAPFAIYTITRVLPLLKGFGHVCVVPVGQG